MDIEWKKKDIQNSTDKYILLIDKHLAQKEKEIMVLK